MAEGQTLSRAQEKKVKAVAEAYPDRVWAERYARKVLKVKLGYRTTPAPIPSDLTKEEALAIEEMVGYQRKKPTRQTRRRSEAPVDETPTEETPTEETPTEEAPVEEIPTEEDAGPLAE